MKGFETHFVSELRPLHHARGVQVRPIARFFVFRTHFLSAAELIS